jgi:predicted house-cleaning noncanonical NTP pyrophosphatase (MazG superfamily)
MRKTYNKLVRDRIPEVMDAAGKAYTLRELREDEYVAQLIAKLHEEASEVSESGGDIEELADTLEVIRALCVAKGHTLEELEVVRGQKAETRGGFQRRLCLVDGEV